MKTIGLLGGMSWESTLLYYRLLNEGVKARLGGLHSAQCLLYSVDFAPVEALQHAGRWDEAATVLIDGAERLRRGGADCLVLCTNTMHKVADAIATQVDLPLLHIADATAQPIVAAGLCRIGLLGTRFTMEEPFYVGRLRDHWGLEVLVPNADDRELVHRVIYDELCLGVITAGAKAGYQASIERLVAAGAEGIILGCTEITLLVEQGDAPVPLFDTTVLHAQAAVAWALDEPS